MCKQSHNGTVLTEHKANRIETKRMEKYYIDINVMSNQLPMPNRYGTDDKKIIPLAISKWIMICYKPKSKILK